MVNSKKLQTYTQNLSILFVEDHEELRQSTTEILKSFFKDVDSAENGVVALTKYKEYYNKNLKNYDIIISDLQLPKLNGVEFTEKIYTIFPQQIIIILSAHDDSKYLLPLINLGIEQFIKKPIDFQELLKVLLKASKKLQQPTLLPADGNLVKIRLSNSFIFDRQNSALLDNNKPIYLTKYEIIFMHYLSQNVGKIYSNEDIAENYTTMNEALDNANIRKLVSKLRKKLPENSLESIYGIGYRIMPYFEA
ncbi:MAG: transcriptional regulator [Helicobacteraceae bacterium CG2_30_36_10]|nr:MAG: transcriptional regulator [Helicobacteraceae bacterium CG2_30_36_10]